MFAKKKVLVTGGTGLVGTPLVEMLLERGAEIRIASLDHPSRAHPKAEFRQTNLLKFESCLEVCAGMDFVFHVAGIKGSPAMTAKKPASFFVPTILMNTNVMEAARQCGVGGYLYTSTNGIYAPASVLREGDVWKTFPSENDKFAGWAKRMGELQAEAYHIEYEWDRVTIVRPANIYGPGDNFDPDNAMVIPSLIRRAVDGENPLVVWGDGSAVRDFIHARDVARGMLLAVESGVKQPMNLGSGVGISIRELVEVIARHLGPKPEVVWDKSKPSGDRIRVLDTSRAKAIGFQPSISIEDGIRETILWYRTNRQVQDRRYNVFREEKFLT
ncbi:MAG: NAD-dependent epimerase/dehydratase family protein [Chloroflexi bacterium]|nr:NAD-dependent epimerase/dehydratase family protein [Chloroflexota bacterium]